MFSVFIAVVVLLNRRTPALKILTHFASKTGLSVDYLCTYIPKFLGTTDLILAEAVALHVIQAARGMNLGGFTRLKELQPDLGSGTKKILTERGQFQGHQIMQRPKEI